MAPQLVATRTVLAGVTGGIVSEVSGGSFANGAYTAAFQHLFNGEAEVFEKMFGGITEFFTGGKVSTDGSATYTATSEGSGFIGKFLNVVSLGIIPCSKPFTEAGQMGVDTGRVVGYTANTVAAVTIVAGAAPIAAKATPLLLTSAASVTSASTLSQCNRHYRSIKWI